MLKDIHCEDCGRFLCKAEFGHFEIKCPNNKCKRINKLNLITAKALHRLTTVQTDANV